MDGWTCGACGRLFARSGQSHDCAPGMTVEEYFETGPVHERPVFDAVYDALTGLGPIHADVVSVGVFFKNPRKFAELRPMQKWVALSFDLPRRAGHRTITRKVLEHNGRYWHTANLATPGDLDDDLRELLAEAYDDALR